MALAPLIHESPKTKKSRRPSASRADTDQTPRYSAAPSDEDPESSYPHPSGKTERQLARAGRIAERQVDRAIRSLGRLTQGGRSSDQRNFRAVFGEPEPARIDEVLQTFHKLKARLADIDSQESLDLRVAPEDEAECQSSLAYTSPGDKRIVFCDSFFELDPKQRGLSLIHEFAHVEGLRSDLYSDSRVFDLLATEPAVDGEREYALRNAESFDRFAAFASGVARPTWIDDDAQFVDRRNAWSGERDPGLESLVRRALAYAEQWVLWGREDLGRIAHGKAPTADQKLLLATIARITPDVSTPWSTIVVDIDSKLGQLESAVGGTMKVELLPSCKLGLSPRYHDAADVPQATISRLRVGPEFADQAPVRRVWSLLSAMLTSFGIDGLDTLDWLKFLRHAADQHVGELRLGPSDLDPTPATRPACPTAPDDFEDL